MICESFFLRLLDSNFLFLDLTLDQSVPLGLSLLHLFGIIIVWSFKGKIKILRLLVYQEPRVQSDLAHSNDIISPKHVVILHSNLEDWIASLEDGKLECLLPHWVEHVLLIRSLVELILDLQDAIRISSVVYVSRLNVSSLYYSHIEVLASLQGRLHSHVSSCGWVATHVGKLMSLYLHVKINVLLELEPFGGQGFELVNVPIYEVRPIDWWEKLTCWCIRLSFSQTCPQTSLGFHLCPSPSHFSIRVTSLLTFQRMKFSFSSCWVSLPFRSLSIKSNSFESLSYRF